MQRTCWVMHWVPKRCWVQSSELRSESQMASCAITKTKTNEIVKWSVFVTAFMRRLLRCLHARRVGATTPSTCNHGGPQASYKVNYSRHRCLSACIITLKVSRSFPTAACLFVASLKYCKIPRGQPRKKKTRSFFYRFLDYPKKSEWNQFFKRG
jgi:hypothetical protein